MDTTIPRSTGASTSLPPSDARLRALRARLLGWYEENGRDLPWRRTTDPYAILVSEVMLQQTPVSRVVPRYEEWMRVWPDLESLAAASFREVLLRWQGLGYNNRALRLHRCAVAVTGSATTAGTRARLPRTLDGLQALPGVGPYTARAVLVFAHNADVAAVDANVRRVLTHELGLPHDLGPKDLQTVADAALPRGRSRDWHNGLMDYGALVLTARSSGIASRRRQGPFQGSRRQRRARLLRRVLAHGPLTLPELATALETTTAEVADLVALLHRDGLVRTSEGRVHVA